MIVRIIDWSRTVTASRRPSTETKDFFAPHPTIGRESIRRTG